MQSILNELLEQRAISDLELSRVTELPRATIYRLRHGKTVDPRISTLQKLADFFGITLDQLLGFAAIDDNTTNPYSMYQVPLLNWNYKQFVDQVESSSTSIKNITIMLRKEEVESNKIIAMEIKSEAMTPKFNLNSTLIIDMNKKSRNGDFVIAHIKKQEELILRKVLIDGGLKYLVAENTVFPTIRLDDDDDIMGVVIESQTKY